jgi:hypothetical protein
MVTTLTQEVAQRADRLAGIERALGASLSGERATAAATAPSSGGAGPIGYSWEEVRASGPADEEARRVRTVVPGAVLNFTIRGGTGDPVQ